VTNESPTDVEQAPLVFDKLLEPVMRFVQGQQKIYFLTCVGIYLGTSSAKNEKNLLEKSSKG
jgi:hypothetical protein